MTFKRGWFVLIICNITIVQQGLGLHVKIGNEIEEEINSAVEASINSEKNTIPIKKASMLECPINKSGFTVHDLETLIDHIATNELNIINTINSSYYDHALAVRDKHITSLKDFQSIVTRRPADLKDILKNMEHTRLDNILPIAKGVTDKLQGLSMQEELYEQKLEKANRILVMLESYNKICALCNYHNVLEPGHLTHFRRNAPFFKDLYYCASLDELYNIIYKKLSTFMEGFLNKIEFQLNNFDLDVTEKIENLKVIIKDKAMKQFRPTIYNILSLQHKYYNFLNENIINNVTSSLSNIKKIFFEIDNTMELLGDDIEKYRQECFECYNKRPRARRDIKIKMQETLPLENPMTPTTDILEELCKSKIDEIENEVHVQAHTIFAELTDIISDDNNLFTDKILIELEPLQEEIKSEVEREEKEFMSIQRILNYNSIQDLYRLYYKSMDLLNKLRNAGKIQNYIN